VLPHFTAEMQASGSAQVEVSGVQASTHADQTNRFVERILQNSGALSLVDGSAVSLFDVQQTCSSGGAADHGLPAEAATSLNQQESSYAELIRNSIFDRI